MAAWLASPPDSWQTATPSSVVAGNRSGIREFNTSYALHTETPSTLNGILKASLTLPEWRTHGCAGFVCRASAPWSFTCCYLYSDKPQNGETFPVVSTYHHGVFRRVAVGARGLHPKSPNFQLEVRYKSAQVRFIATCDGETAEVSAAVYDNPFPGQVGVIRHYDCWAFFDSFEWSPIWMIEDRGSGKDAWEWDVFLSYSVRALGEAQEIERQMTLAGLRVWIDYKEVKPGDNFVSSLDYGLRNSGAVVAVINKGFMEQGWRHAEYTSYLSAMLAQGPSSDSARQRRVVPLLLQEATVDDMPFLFRPLNTISYPGQRWLERLSSALRPA